MLRTNSRSEGPRSLAREAARWSGELHALVGGGVECQDHADLMEAYSASLEECEADAAPASLPEPAPAEQATPPLFDAAAGCWFRGLQQSWL